MPARPLGFELEAGLGSNGMKHYGQFPANFGPTRTLMAFQAHHIDTAFYDRFYRPGAYTEAHAEHFARWHGAAGA